MVACRWAGSEVADRLTTQGKQNAECGPARRLAFSRDFPAMFLDDLASDCQPQAAPVLLGRKERLEQPGQIVRSDTCSIVGNPQFQQLLRLGLWPRLFGAAGDDIAANRNRSVMAHRFD